MTGAESTLLSAVVGPWSVRGRGRAGAGAGAGRGRRRGWAGAGGGRGGAGWRYGSEGCSLLRQLQMLSTTGRGPDTHHRYDSQPDTRHTGGREEGAGSGEERGGGGAVRYTHGREGGRRAISTAGRMLREMAFSLSPHVWRR